ncbi:MAG: hypothetical protein IJ086_00470 [Clostridium sp.]|nr:hypothetical protein [Clostridium sp.]
MLKQIKDLNVLIDGRWSKVTDQDGKIIYEGGLPEKMSHEDVYRAVTAKYEFRLKSNDKFLTSYDRLNTFPGEREAVLEDLAHLYNCSINDIEVRLVIEDI